jgi:hypothetical protein
MEIIAAICTSDERIATQGTMPLVPKAGITHLQKIGNPLV